MRRRVHTGRCWWDAQGLDEDRARFALNHITRLFQIANQFRQAVNQITEVRSIERLLQIDDNFS
jgi:uncharacterized protein YfaT (DUF1175 family)